MSDNSNIKSQNAAVIWFTGLSGAGKSTLAIYLANELKRRAIAYEHVDGDSVREIFPETGFDPSSRRSHIKRIGHLASVLEKHGITVVASFISPEKEVRDFVRKLCSNFVEVYLCTPIEECQRRDPKKLYARARAGQIQNFTGIHSRYEPPTQAEIKLDTTQLTVEQAGEKILKKTLSLLSQPKREKSLWWRKLFRSLATQEG